jgi:glucosamine-6-phosphate deaminase
MNHHLFANINIRAENIHFPDASLPGEVSAARYSKELETLGPVDLQILGIGKNGHIGFNEPGSGVDSRTRVVELSSETINRNKAPANKAITMGIWEILSAKTIILMASGEDKSDALFKAIREPPNPSVPASFLQYHKNTYIFADKAAAGSL